MFDARRVLLLLSLQACTCLPVHAAPAVSTPAPNCGLSQPPSDAGVDRHGDVVLRIYPRNPDIGPRYAGCQTLWMQDGDTWQTLTVVHYEAGRVSWIETAMGDKGPLDLCLVKNGVVLRGDPAQCAELDTMRFESAPASCLSASATGASARCTLE
jgi:hypothetical protein